jgi:hypothetical protein
VMPLAARDRKGKTCHGGTETRRKSGDPVIR